MCTLEKHSCKKITDAIFSILSKSHNGKNFLVLYKRNEKGIQFSETNPTCLTRLTKWVKVGRKKKS